MHEPLALQYYNITRERSFNTSTTILWKFETANSKVGTMTTVLRSRDFVKKFEEALKKGWLSNKWLKCLDIDILL